MHWYLTIPFALGIFLSSLLVDKWPWELVLLLAGLSTMWYLMRRGCRVMPLLVVNSILLGSLYGQFRSSFALGREVTAPTLSRHVSFSSPCLSESHQATLSAMLLGDRSHLSQAQKQLYRHAGASHLLALSGAHLGILLTIFGLLMLPRVRFSPWRWWVFGFILAFLWGYALAVGLPRSLLRASLMSSCYLLGLFSLRPTRGYDILGTSVLFMLLLDPSCVFDVGAQFSVSALVGITCFYPLLRNLFLTGMERFHPGLHPSYSWWERRLRDLLRFFLVSLSAWLFTLPLVAYYFREFQPWQALTGVVLVPATSVVMYGALLMSLLSVLGDVMAFYAATLQEYLMNVHDAILLFFARLPFASVRVPFLSLWQVALLYLIYAQMAVMLWRSSWRILRLFLLTVTLSMVLLFLFFRC